MSVFKQMETYGHEQLVLGYDGKTGLKTIIAVHDTTLGPAVGGTRFLDYKTEEDALFDVLRLSRGMSLKNAAAGLKLGGGKAVIIGDPSKLKSRDFFHAYGKVVNSVGGKYITAEDVNTNETDISHIKEATPYVTGTPAISGNPSPFTARGVYKGMKAGASVKFGTDSLKGLTVVVQGLGSVGYVLCEHLHDEGALLKVYDVNNSAVTKACTELGAQAISASEVLTASCDIFSPCALGAVLNTTNVKHLKCKMICGAANNVLLNPETGDALKELDILYLPDYIVNAGGIINCGIEVTDKEAYSVDTANKMVDNIYNTVLTVIDIAKREGISTYAAADLFALDKIRRNR